MGKKGGETDSSGKLSLKKVTKKKIGYLQKKPKVTCQEAYNVVKNFFKEYTGKNYEFTREELLEELEEIYMEEEVRSSVRKVVMSLGRIEFTDPNYSPDEIKDMLGEFENSMEYMVKPENTDLGFWDKFAKLFSRKKEKLKEEPAEEGEFVKELAEIKDFWVLSGKFSDEMMSGNIEDARKTYVDMREAYDEVSDDRKEEAYEKINRAYEELSH